MFHHRIPLHRVAASWYCNSVQFYRDGIWAIGPAWHPLTRYGSSHVKLCNNGLLGVRQLPFDNEVYKSNGAFNSIPFDCHASSCAIITHLSHDSVQIPSAWWSNDFKSWSVSQSVRQSPQSTHVTTLSHSYPLHSCSILEIQSMHALPAYESLAIIVCHWKKICKAINVIGLQIFQWCRSIIKESCL